MQAFLCLVLVLARCMVLLGYEYDESFYDDGYNVTAGGSYGYGYSNYYRSPDDNTYTWSSKDEGGHSCEDGVCPQYQSFDYAEHPQDLTYLYDNCFLDDDNQAIVNGTDTCDLLVVGIDVAADRLEGGLDGVYKLTSCYFGKPKYERVDGPKGERRVLWYNTYYGDWEFSVGADPSEDFLVMYGDFGWLSPYQIPNWHLAAALNSYQAGLMESEEEDLYYIVPEVSVTCVGKNEEPASTYNALIDS